MAFLLSACAALFPKDSTAKDRLDAFPSTPAPVAATVEIRWNEQQVPYVYAATDTDLAFALGAVHHHLRAGQIRILKHISQGRIAELAGPPARGIDHSLKILDFGKAAPFTIAGWPDETRAFMEAFIAGMNWHQANSAPPPEFALIGLSPEPWKPEDLVTIGRLASADVNWLTLISALRERGNPGWDALWARMSESGGGLEPPELTDEEADETLQMAGLLQGLSRSGSNSLVLAPERSASGHAMIANDPHLGLNLPNLWLLAGIKSPSYDAVGMMIPGLPFIALGRNHDIAWGGTNARTLASDLVDVSGLDDTKSRKATIKTRLWFDREVQIRDSRHGPVMTDSPFIPAGEGEAIALKWVGHQTSDEISAFLKAMRASDTKGFRDAFASYGVSGQNMLVVDRHGSIAKVLAAWLPKRPERPTDDLIVAGDPEPWEGLDTVLTMGWVNNPETGYIVSANDNPSYAGRDTGRFFSPGDRINRMAAVIDRHGTLSIDDLKALQADVRSPAARNMAQALAARARAAGLEGAMVDELAEWDGAYTIEARGPVVFETLLFHLAKGLYGRGPEAKVSASYGQWSLLRRYLLEDIDAKSDTARRELLNMAFAKAEVDAAKFDRWGDMHRVRVGHILANIPVLGRSFVLDDLPSAGSRETLMKRSHGLVNTRHRASFGAQARHISDMADPDANYFALFGGQDGWLGSRNFADQIPLFRDSDYLQLPLRPETVAERFKRRTDLVPSG